MGYLYPHLPPCGVATTPICGVRSTPECGVLQQIPTHFSWFKLTDPENRKGKEVTIVFIERNSIIRMF